MKNVIVTGANGLIGIYLTKHLSENGVEIYAIIRNEEENIEAIRDLPGVHIVYCDLSEIDSLTEKLEVKEIEVFYHLAWEGSSGDKRADYIIQLKNANAACKAAEVAFAFKCKKFIGAGSVTELTYRDYLLLDNSKPEMTANYAIAKMTANFMCKCICNLKSIGFNWSYIANLYGVGDETQNIINVIMQSYMRGEVPLLTAGEQLADFVYVSDVAGALAAIGERGVSGTTYYIGGNNIKPLKEFVVQMRDEINSELETGLGKKEFFGRDIDFSKVNRDKLCNDTGYIPKISFNQGIRLMHQWLEGK